MTQQELDIIIRNTYNQIFRQPLEPTKTVLWRYLRDFKFDHLLKTATLYLTKVSDFPDPVEGTLSIPSKEAIREFEEHLMAGYDSGKWEEIERDMRQTTFANCWHINSHESEYMWEAYCPEHEGVVLTTTFARLREACADAAHEKFFLGCVNYIMDWTTYEIEIGNAFHRFTHKDGTYGKEQEARILSIGGADQPHIEMPIDHCSLITSIRVHPCATQEYYEQVVSRVATLVPCLTNSVKWSDLRRPQSNTA